MQQRNIARNKICRELERGERHLPLEFIRTSTNPRSVAPKDRHFSWKETKKNGLVGS
eukprot:gene8690-6111_t